MTLLSAIWFTADSSVAYVNIQSRRPCEHAVWVFMWIFSSYAHVNAQFWRPCEHSSRALANSQAPMWTFSSGAHMNIFSTFCMFWSCFRILRGSQLCFRFVYFGIHNFFVVVFADISFVDGWVLHTINQTTNHLLAITARFITGFFHFLSSAGHSNVTRTWSMLQYVSGSNTIANGRNYRSCATGRQS